MLYDFTMRYFDYIRAIVRHCNNSNDYHIRPKVAKILEKYSWPQNGYFLYSHIFSVIWPSVHPVTWIEAFVCWACYSQAV